MLTASAMRSCIASFERENHEKSLDAEAGPAGGAQLSFLHGGSDICAASWTVQAVSDLSAIHAPSRALWDQLSAFYNVCEVVCVTVVCIGIQGQKTRLLRTGIYLFAVMEWLSAIGYRMFPLSESGYAGAFQDVMHMVVTAAVVLLSIVSLSMIIAAGAKDRRCRSYGICAGIALGMMLVGALGIKLVPAAYFGVVERFSVFAATGFNTALGIHLFCTRPENERPQGRI